MRFLDRVRVFVRSGAGGAGAVSFRRERNLRFGGPDGGDGGRGGDVLVEAVDDLNTLIDFRYQPHFKAANGEAGRGRLRSGAGGRSVRMRVPVGTEILDRDGQSLIADLTRCGQVVILARGGKGGFGNHRFKSSINQAPRRAGEGEGGVERELVLQLKVVADVGIIGMPNAGKSTFLSACSAASPKIAEYPFTTLEPHIGVVALDGSEMVIADIPGLIEDAHLGKGLGTRFLGHVERCKLLLHLVDATSESPITDWRIVDRELAAHGPPVSGLHRVIALSKVDAVSRERAEHCAGELSEAIGGPIMQLSSVSGDGIESCLRNLMSAVTHARKPEEQDLPWIP